MEDNNRFFTPKQNEPKDIIGTSVQKDELAQKVVVSEEMPAGSDDPYDGYLKKTNFLVFVLFVASIITFALGLILMIYYVIKFSSSGAALTFTKIKLGVIVVSAGFASVVVFGVLRSIVEKKRRGAYSSKHTTKTFEKFEVKQHEAEGAKKGMSTSETTLSISETKEDYKYCPHCHARIPKSTGLFCPKCGKRLNSAPMNDF